MFPSTKFCPKVYKKEKIPHLATSKTMTPLVIFPTPFLPNPNINPKDPRDTAKNIPTQTINKSVEKLLIVYKKRPKKTKIISNKAPSRIRAKKAIKKM